MKIALFILAVVYSIRSSVLFFQYSKRRDNCIRQSSDFSELISALLFIAGAFYP